ncbi:MAG: hypothetical protein RID07_20880, partial [Lacipirellulaceae bacterium]
LFPWLINALMMIASALTGSKSRRISGGTTTQTMRERSQANRAEQKLAEEEEEFEDLKQQERVALEDLDIEYQPNRLPIEKIEIGPRKSDISVDKLTLVWLPFWKHQDGRATAAY